MKKQIISGALFIITLVFGPAKASLIGDSSAALWDLDVSTNTATFIGDSGSGAWFDIALDPTTDILYGLLNGRSLYSIDQSNGARTRIGSTGQFLNGLTFDSSGTLYGTGGRNLYTVDLTLGSASTVGSTGFTSSGDIVFDSLGNLYLSATNGAGGDQLVSINSTTGAGTTIGSIGFGTVYGLSFFDDTLYGFTANGLTLEIDVTSGTGTQIATNGIVSYGASSVASVPEPSVFALLGAGLIGLGF